MFGKICGCGTKGKVKPTLKYCGKLLPCTGIVKGDDYSTVLEKIEAVACNGGGGTDCCNYTFTPSESCPNGGIIVRKDEDIIFEQCYECCGGEDRTVYYEQVKSELLIEYVPSLTDANSIPGYKTQVSYTITPTDGAGIYELYFTGHVYMEGEKNIRLGIYINNLMEVVTFTTPIICSDMGDVKFTTETSLLRSNLALNVGDEIGICLRNNTNTNRPLVIIQPSIWKLTKIG